MYSLFFSRVLIIWNYKGELTIESECGTWKEGNICFPGMWTGLMWEVSTYSTHLFRNVSRCENIHGSHLKLPDDDALVYAFILIFTLVENNEFK